VIQPDEQKYFFIMLTVWRKYSNSSASEFHGAFDGILHDNF